MIIPAGDGDRRRERISGISMSDQISVLRAELGRPGQERRNLIVLVS